jgi:hypothetical protein
MFLLRAYDEWSPSGLRPQVSKSFDFQALKCKIVVVFADYIIFSIIPLYLAATYVSAIPYFLLNRFIS